MPDFLGLHKTVVHGLSVWHELGTFQEPMAIFGESQNFPRIRTPFDGFLFGEAVPGQVFNVVFHPRVLAVV